jgi:glycosyltransferase involved in cell wall biosynthesis
MKQVLFVITNLGCGGINRALENLIYFIKDDINVSIMSFVPHGQYEDRFGNIRVFNAGFLLDVLTRNLSSQKGLTKIFTAAIKFSNRLSKGLLKNYLYNRTIKRVSKTNYDTVIAFSEGLPTGFVAHLSSDNKIAWIHCDYKSYLNVFRGTLKHEQETYSYYNKIVCVSDFTKQSFEDAMPECIGKVMSIPNVLDTESMKRQSVEFIPDFMGTFNIVTVGRIDHIKHQSVIPAVLAQIIKVYPDSHWYVVGPNAEQAEYDKLMTEIKNNGLNDNIHLLGQQDNPYPYIKNANLLVTTSLSEACPYVINEAKVLGTPVICTNFGSAKQFVTNGKDGYSVSIENMSKTILKLMSDSSIYNKIKDNLAKFEYDNNEIINLFKNLI